RRGRADGGGTSTGTWACSTGCGPARPDPARGHPGAGQQNGRVVHIGRNVDPGIARSWLLVNGARTELFDSAHDSRADQIVLDIEDAVDPARKPAARTDVVEYLSSGD